jgi:hypothetical protein
MHRAERRVEGGVQFGLQGSQAFQLGCASGAFRQVGFHLRPPPPAQLSVQVRY